MGCARSTRMTCPRGEFGPAGGVGRRHRLAATGGGARPGDPREPHLQLGARHLGSSRPAGPRGVRCGRSRPGAARGVPMVQVGRARASGGCGWVECPGPPGPGCAPESHGCPGPDGGCSLVARRPGTPLGKKIRGRLSPPSVPRTVDRRSCV